MSHFQSKGERSEAQFKKSGRPGSGAAYQRAGGPFPTAKGGGVGGPSPSASASLGHHNSSSAPQPGQASIPISGNKGGKRSNGAAGLSRGTSSSASSESYSNHKLQSNALPQHQSQPHLQLQPGPQSPKQQPPPPVPSSNGAISRSSRSGTSFDNPAAVSPGEAARGNVQPPFSFQFGSISPGFMHNTGMQIPARTSSAPPNLDEQIRDQARFVSAAVAPIKVAAVSSGQPQQQQQQQRQARIENELTAPVKVLSVSSGQLQQQESVSARQTNHMIEQSVPTSRISSVSTAAPSAVHPQQQAVSPPTGISQAQFSQGQGYSLPGQYLQPGSHIQQQVTVPSQAHLQIQAQFAAAQAQHQALSQQPIAQPTIAPQQGIMQQNPGQSMKFQQSMISTPHASQMVPSPLTSMPGQLQPQQIPTQLAHQLGPHLGGPLGTQLPAAVQYVPTATSQQLFMQVRTNRAVKIVHPDTHEELRFEARGKKTDCYMENSPGRVASNGASQVRPSVGYGGGPHHQMNTAGFYTGLPGGSYPHPSQSYYPTGPLKPSAAAGTPPVRFSFSHPPLAQNVPFQNNPVSSVPALTSKVGHSSSSNLEISGSYSGTTAVETSAGSKGPPASQNQAILNISNKIRSTVQGTTSTVPGSASTMQGATSGSALEAEIFSTEVNRKQTSSAMGLVKLQGNTVPNAQQTVINTDTSLQFGDVETSKAVISSGTDISTDCHNQMPLAISKPNNDVFGPGTSLSVAISVTESICGQEPVCSTEHVLHQDNSLDLIPQVQDVAMMMQTLQQGVLQEPDETLQKHEEHCSEDKDDSDVKLAKVFDLEGSTDVGVVGSISDNTMQVVAGPDQKEIVEIDVPASLEEHVKKQQEVEESWPVGTREISRKISEKEQHQHQHDSRIRSKPTSVHPDIDSFVNTASEAKQDIRKHEEERCKEAEESDAKLAKGVDPNVGNNSSVFAPILDNIKHAAAKPQLKQMRCTVETDVMAFEQEHVEKQQEADASKPSDAGTSEDDREVGEDHQQHQEEKVEDNSLISKTPSSYPGHDTDVASQQQQLQQDNPVSSKLTSSNPGHQTDSSTNAAPEVKQSSKKKKLKEILARADAAGTSADLYNAYKAPEKKQDEMKMVEVQGIAASTGEATSYVTVENFTSRELEDWEDAAELPSPRVTAGYPDPSAAIDSGLFATADSEFIRDRKYTRDFLLTLRDHNRELPSDFEIRADVAELLLNLADRDLLQSPGRMLDRQLSGGPRLERRGSTVGSSDEDRWTRPGLVPSPGRGDMRMDMGLAGPASGFRSGVGLNPGLIARMPPGLRPGMPMPNFGMGLIPGAPLIPVPAGSGLVRGADADRWQRSSSAQKGLIPSPQSSVPSMHKAEKRYEVGKASDEEAAKQRQIKGILNKLTPQNFDKLFEKVKEVNIETAHTLTGVISQIFDKALMEPFFCEMYAKFCVQLATELPEFNEDGVKITFKRVLLNKCQEEFERGEREQAEADRPEEEGEVKLSPEEREEKRVKARRRMLGNIRFIGELYKESMLTERIMHECILKLLGEYQNPDEEDVEALCKLMSTIGRMIDHSKAKEHIDAYFVRMAKLSDNHRLPSRLRFMLKDVIDLRRNGWQERRKVEGPKKIDEVHRDAVQERHATVAQASRLPRGSGMGTSSGRRLTSSQESSTRGRPTSPLFSPSSTGGPPMGPPRGVQQPQMGIRGAYGQDVRTEDRLLIDSRPFPMPLSQRSADDLPITLGPQGGLGRGMSVRGQPLPPGRSALADVPSMILGERRFGPGSLQTYGSRDDISQRVSGADRPLTQSDRPLLERPIVSERYGSGPSGVRALERTLSDRPVSMLMSSKPSQHQAVHAAPTIVTSSTSSVTSAPLSEEQLKKKSQMTIVEFYSVRDMKEAAQCVEDLKSPSFHSVMISLWISDSFEKKDIERDLVVNLLINLNKTEPFLLKEDQIVKGFELVLSMLEDTFLDAPKAPEYLAVMFGKLIAAGAISLAQVGSLLKEGGMEPGSLVMSGTSIKILGSVLETVRREKGESVMLELYRSSALQLEDFTSSEDTNSGWLNDFLELKNLHCLCPMIPMEQHLRELLSKDEAPLEILKWLERHTSLAMHSDPAFLRMIMAQVLRHSAPSAIGDYEKDDIKDFLGGRIKKYAPVLRHFVSGTARASEASQRQYIAAVQLFMNELGHPSGLMTTLFTWLYEEEVISEFAFCKWQDDVKDSTPGRDKAIREVGKWLQWLATAPEEAEDD